MKKAGMKKNKGEWKKNGGAILFPALFPDSSSLLLAFCSFLLLRKIAWEDWWAYLLLALGGIFIFEVLLRSIMPAYRRPVYGKLIAGLVLIAIGASNIYGFVSWWPLIIIGVGVFILFSALLRPRK
jgi:hypothetical protein